MEIALAKKDMGCTGLLGHALGVRMVPVLTYRTRRKLIAHGDDLGF
jgi:hypothetical protein